MNWYWAYKLLIPVVINILKSYIKSTESKQDDKVLEIAQEASTYLSAKDNNTVSINTSDLISKAVIK